MPHVYREGRNFLFCSGPPCNICMTFFLSPCLLFLFTNCIHHTIPTRPVFALPPGTETGTTKTQEKKNPSSHTKDGWFSRLLCFALCVVQASETAFYPSPPFTHAYLTPFPTQTHCSSCMTPTLFIEHWFCFPLSSFIIYFFLS